MRFELAKYYDKKQTKRMPSSLRIFVGEMSQDYGKAKKKSPKELHEIIVATDSPKTDECIY